GPGREPLPGQDELFACGLITALYAKVIDHLIERQAVKTIEVGPRQLSQTHPIHVRDIERAPCVRHPLPVSLDAMQPSEPPALGSHSRTPVDGGSEDVEREGADIAQVRHDLSPDRMGSNGTGLGVTSRLTSALKNSANSQGPAVWHKRGSNGFRLASGLAKRKAEQVGGFLMGECRHVRAVRARRSEHRRVERVTCWQSRQLALAHF